MAIPKKIHYCWFGGNPKSKLIKKCLKSWKKYCPDYQIIEWNEKNFDIQSCPLYVRQAYDAKKWAFVTDYARLKIIHENGGVYFDTDVELIKKIDDLLKHNAYFGIEKHKQDKFYIATGLGFGAIKKAPILKELMDSYNNIPFFLENGEMNTTSCLMHNNKCFAKYGFNGKNEKQIIRDQTLVLSSEYLCPMDWKGGASTITENTYSIHHYEASWYSPDEKEKLKQVRKQRAKKERKYYIKTLPNRIVKKILGTENYEKIKHLLKKQ